jgi:hypothetical protein
MIVEPLTVTPDSFTVIAKFAAEHKLPVGGALMAVGDYKSAFGVTIDNIAVGKQAALLADKILKGTPAGTIPVASPENVLQINYKAAQARCLKGCCGRRPKSFASSAEGTEPCRAVVFRAFPSQALRSSDQ